MVEARRSAEFKEERADLFSNLLDANEEEQDSEAKLTDSKLIGRFTSFFYTERSMSQLLAPGNVFLFLVAGYEVR